MSRVLVTIQLSLQEMINIAIEENKQSIEFIESLNLDILDAELFSCFLKLEGQDQGEEDFKEKSFNFLFYG